MIFKFVISAVVKRWFCYGLVVTLGLLSHIPTGYAETGLQNPPNTKILILGDSLSASLGMAQQDGWVALLQARFDARQAHITLINASISGETTAGGLARSSKIFAQQQPDVVLIELGGNDGLRGFPVKKAQDNLLQIIQQAQQQNILPALMQIRIPPNFGPRYTEKFQAIYPALAAATQAQLVPFFMEAIVIKPELMQGDGIHPNKAAQPLIAAAMDQALMDVLGEPNKR